MDAITVLVQTRTLASLVVVVVVVVLSTLMIKRSFRGGFVGGDLNAGRFWFEKGSNHNARPPSELFRIICTTAITNRGTWKEPWTSRISLPSRNVRGRVDVIVAQNRRRRHFLQNL